jgi:hypothetical protein
MNTDEGEIPFGGRQDARQREKHLVIIGVYPRSSAPVSLAIPFRFSSFVNSYSSRRGLISTGSSNSCRQRDARAGDAGRDGLPATGRQSLPRRFA